MTIHACISSGTAYLCLAVRRNQVQFRGFNRNPMEFGHSMAFFVDRRKVEKAYETPAGISVLTASSRVREFLLKPETAALCVVLDGAAQRRLQGVVAPGKYGLVNGKNCTDYVKYVFETTFPEMPLRVRGLRGFGIANPDVLYDEIRNCRHAQDRDVLMFPQAKGLHPQLLAS